MIDAFVSAIWVGLSPTLPWLLPILLAAAALTATLPGRGSKNASRDPWRSFKFGARAEVMSRADGQCEAPAVVVFGRCSALATDADHVYPWSRGGPTIVSNGAALCRAHNRAKGARNPPWWYVLGLERRRRGYFPDGADVRVSAIASAEDAAARAPRGARAAAR